MFRFRMKINSINQTIITNDEIIIVFFIIRFTGNHQTIVHILLTP